MNTAALRSRAARLLGVGLKLIYAPADQIVSLVDAHAEALDRLARIAELQERGLFAWAEHDREAERARLVEIGELAKSVP